MEPNEPFYRPGAKHIAYIPAGFVLTAEVCKLIREANIEKGSPLTEEESIECRDYVNGHGQ